MTLPFYRVIYARRRNSYCEEHITSSRHPFCSACKVVRQSRNKLTPFEIGNNTPKGDKLELAAVLEYAVCQGDMDLATARYKFVEQYPDSNCLLTPVTYSVSVLWYILPYPDTLHTLPDSPIRNKKRKVLV